MGEQACPHCDYALAGLPRDAGRCPECGGELSALAFAKGVARRMARNGRARLALLVSPGVGVVVAIAAFAMHRGAYAALAGLLICLWAGAAVALHCTTGRPESRRPVRAVLLGLPLGIAYFVAVFGAAVGIVLVIAWIRGSR